MWHKINATDRDDITRNKKNWQHGSKVFMNHAEIKPYLLYSIIKRFSLLDLKTQVFNTSYSRSFCKFLSKVLKICCLWNFKCKTEITKFYWWLNSKKKQKSQKRSGRHSIVQPISVTMQRTNSYLTWFKLDKRILNIVFWSIDSTWCNLTYSINSTPQFSVH